VGAPDGGAGAEEERRRAGRQRARAVARDFLARGDATGWFEAFYRDAGGDPARVPWADRAGHPLLAAWLAGAPGAGRRALVVGSGLGEDAELCSRAGYEVVAFDLAPTAVRMCRELWPGTRVRYVAADLLAPPAEWLAAFDLVVEVYTLQALPLELRERAIARIAGFVAPRGRLVVVTMGRGDEELPAELPWPLSRTELARLELCGLEPVSFREVFEESEGRSVPRWLAEYARSG
jgi:SAM-dependent methyltransferase